jgi:hypothetical protein
MFALYLGAGNINDDDPHQTQMANLIIEKYNDEVKRIAEELGQALGRISFSMDLWSNPNLCSFMAVTAHYIIRDKSDGGRLKYKCGLVTFRHITTTHSGEHLAEHFFNILLSLKITHKVSLQHL